MRIFLVCSVMVCVAVVEKDSYPVLPIFKLLAEKRKH